MIKRFIYRNSGAGGEGGATPAPSLADLDKEEEEVQKTQEELDAEQKAADDKKAEEEAAKKKEEEEQETPEQKAEREAAEKQELEDKKKKEEDAADKTKPEDKTEEESDEAEEFFADVDKLRGDTIEVDYGTIDPLSPEGVVLRERKVEEKAVEDFEAHLEEKFPKAYAYLLHVSAGLPEEEFFGKATDLETLPTVEELEASVEVQKSILTKDLAAKGNSEKIINLTIQQAITDNELEEMSKTALANQKKAQDDQIAATKKANDDALAERQDAINKMAAVVDNVVKEGKIGNITIPEKDRTAFAAEFKKGVRYENGKFVFVTELTNENLQSVFGKEFFSFKKGNLEQIVTAAAKTENAKRLRRTIPEKKAPSSSAESKSKSVPLSELETD